MIIVGVVLVTLLGLALGLPHAKQSTSDLSPQYLDLWQQINSNRVYYGNTTLCISSALMDSALRQSNIQAGLGALTHSDNNEPFIYRFDAVGFVGSLFGENVVQTLSYNATQIMGMFMYDPSNKANVIGNFTHVGMASVSSSSGAIYWTIHFGQAYYANEPCLAGADPAGPFPPKRSYANNPTTGCRLISAVTRAQAAGWVPSLRKYLVEKP